PAMLGVGYIIGPRIAGIMFAGGVLGWLGIIPLISFIGDVATTPIYPGEVPVAEMGAEDIWENYFRYIRSGAVAFGRSMGLMKSLPTIAPSFAGSLRGFSGAGSEETLRTDRDMSMPLIIILTVVFIGILLLYPAIDIGIIGIILLFIFGFFFVTVSSRFVLIVCCFSIPVSVMTIGALIFISLIF